MSPNETNPLDFPLHIILSAWLLRRLVVRNNPPNPQLTTIDEMYAGQDGALKSMIVFQNIDNPRLSRLAGLLFNHIIAYRLKLKEKHDKLAYFGIKYVVVVPFADDRKEKVNNNEESKT